MYGFIASVNEKRGYELQRELHKGMWDFFGARRQEAKWHNYMIISKIKQIIKINKIL